MGATLVKARLEPPWSAAMLPKRWTSHFLFLPLILLSTLTNPLRSLRGYVNKQKKLLNRKCRGRSYTRILLEKKSNWKNPSKTESRIFEFPVQTAVVLQQTTAADAAPDRGELRFHGENLRALFFIFCRFVPKNDEYSHSGKWWIPWHYRYGARANIAIRISSPRDDLVMKWLKIPSVHPLVSQSSPLFLITCPLIMIILIVILYLRSPSWILFKIDW